ncbi:unnamed protein product [Zymoseptoria tritici ST99CH_3D1]|nr:unnamed protein product [Zymoseptoria tritici ST99CH_3D1]
MNIAEVLEAIVELQKRPKCVDWSARTQYVCEVVWNLPSTPDAWQTTQFATFLNNGDVFALARLVVPALRERDIVVPTKYHQHLLDGTQHLRSSANATPKSQTDFDTALHRAKKQAFFDADPYRTQLFLRRSGKFGSEEEAAVQEWLAKCPVGKGDNKRR